jgi:hypothetical protein
VSFEDLTVLEQHDPIIGLLCLLLMFKEVDTSAYIVYVCSMVVLRKILHSANHGCRYVPYLIHLPRHRISRLGSKLGH